jgi:predicted Co/Zn/Cd cation transporter (cation efflux family)
VSIRCENMVSEYMVSEYMVTEYMVSEYKVSEYLVRTKTKTWKVTSCITVNLFRGVIVAFVLNFFH